MREINFDGIVGPSHNYAGLSPGNLAATRNAGLISRPRAAALQGIAKMRANLDLGLTQGIFYPLARPDHRWLETLSTTYDRATPHLQARAAQAIGVGHCRRRWCDEVGNDGAGGRNQHDDREPAGCCHGFVQPIEEPRVARATRAWRMHDRRQRDAWHEHEDHC